MTGPPDRARTPFGHAHLGRAAVAACVALCALAACRGATDPGGEEPGEVVAADQLTTRVETATHVYLMAPGDRVDTAAHEAHYRWLTAALGVTPPARLEFHKYRDRDHLRRVTGRTTNGFAEPGTARFHTVWPWDNHEGVHALVVLTMGHPPALFNEGVAVAHQTNPLAGDTTARWNGRPLHDLAAQLDAAGQLPALDALLDSRAFFDYAEGVTYPAAGSWVRYLLDRYGVAPFRALLAGGSFDQPAAATRARFRSAYGVGVDDAWADWRRFLRER